MRTGKNLDRVHRFHLREVTGALPEFPPQYISCDNDDSPFPDSYQIQSWFYLELHVRNWGWFGPVGQGTIVVDADGDAELIGMYILDGLRCQGYGRALIEEAAKHWSNLSWSGCPEARAFNDRLVAQGIAECTYDSDTGYSRYKFVRPLNLPFENDQEKPCE